jgi:hypothetical protein
MCGPDLGRPFISQRNLTETHGCDFEPEHDPRLLRHEYRRCAGSSGDPTIKTAPLSHVAGWQADASTSAIVP